MARSALVLAIDGGQSGTTALLGDGDGQVLGLGRGGPLVDVRRERSEAQTRRALSAAVRAATTRLGDSRPQIDLAYLALTGAADVAETVLGESVAARDVVVENDVFAALASGTLGGPGVGVVAGTGAIAVAQRRDGSRVVRGGWGFLVGDQGSGFAIGLEAMRAAASMEDGVMPVTELHELVVGHFGAGDMRDVAALVYAELDRAAIAALAPAVLAAAERGEAPAGEIVRRAARALAELTAATAAAAGPGDEDERRVVPAGGALRPGNALWRGFAEDVAELLPAYRLLPPRWAPVVGAYCLALMRLGISVDAEIADRIDDSLARLPDGAALSRAAEEVGR